MTDPPARPLTYRLSRLVVLTGILMTVLILVLWWRETAVCLAQQWVAAVDAWQDRATPW